jgi:hypothetical protein
VLIVAVVTVVIVPSSWVMILGSSDEISGVCSRCCFAMDVGGGGASGDGRFRVAGSLRFVVASEGGVVPWIAVVAVFLLVSSFEKRPITGISKNRPGIWGTQGFTLRLDYIGFTCYLYMYIILAVGAGKTRDKEREPTSSVGCRRTDSSQQRPESSS